MKVKTGRFGELNVEANELIQIPSGILGFSEYTKFCLVDPGDDTLILWLQSIENPDFALAVLEPKVFKGDYTVRLSAAELRELKLDNINQAAVFSILTIPEDVTQMTANLKAPLVINLETSLMRQVVLQENEYSLKHPMFKELRTHLMTIQAQKQSAISQQNIPVSTVKIHDLRPSSAVRSLQS